MSLDRLGRYRRRVFGASQDFVLSRDRAVQALFFYRKGLRALGVDVRGWESNLIGSCLIRYNHKKILF